jgi:hypothetical protein
MRPSPDTRISLSRAFGRLAWSNLLAQCAEQVSLAAAPLVAVFAVQLAIIAVSPVARLGALPDRVAA